MPFILRVDIDKPYGHHSLFAKLLSKIKENFYFPSIDSLGYSKPIQELLKFCNLNKIPAILYFRNCTIPNEKTNYLIKEGDYLVGFHAEETQSMLSFQNELTLFEKKIGNKIKTFTKHGSGKLKLGKNHYPPYEPEKYLEWAKNMSLNYSFGNGIPNDIEDLFSKNDFYENMFWLERSYRKPPLEHIEDIIEAAKSNTIILVVHPANFFTYQEVKEDLLNLIKISKTNKIDWINSL